MPENDIKKITPPLRQIRITSGDDITPMIFLFNDVAYKADIARDDTAGFPGVELTVRENNLIKMILANRDGFVALALANELLPEQWEDLKRAYLALLSLVETMSGGAPWESALEYVPDPSDRLTILEWKERFTRNDL